MAHQPSGAQPSELAMFDMNTRKQAHMIRQARQSCQRAAPCTHLRPRKATTAKTMHCQEILPLTKSHLLSKIETNVMPKHVCSASFACHLIEFKLTSTHTHTRTHFGPLLCAGRAERPPHATGHSHFGALPFAGRAERPPREQCTAKKSCLTRSHLL